MFAECPWLMLMFCGMTYEHGRILSIAVRARPTSEQKGLLLSVATSATDGIVLRLPGKGWDICLKASATLLRAFL